MDKTATQALMEQHEMERRESRMHQMQKMFREKWGPDHGRNEFEADLALLMQEVAIYALQPFQNAAAHQIASRPLSPMAIKERVLPEAKLFD